MKVSWQTYNTHYMCNLAQLFVNKFWEGFFKNENIIRISSILNQSCCQYKSSLTFDMGLFTYDVLFRWNRTCFVRFYSNLCLGRWLVFPLALFYSDLIEKSIFRHHRTVLYELCAVKIFWNKIPRTARCVRFWSWFTIKVCCGSKKFGQHYHKWTNPKADWQFI